MGSGSGPSAPDPNFYITQLPGLRPGLQFYFWWGVPHASREGSRASRVDSALRAGYPLRGEVTPNCHPPPNFRAQDVSERSELTNQRSKVWGWVTIGGDLPSKGGESGEITFNATENPPKTKIRSQKWGLGGSAGVESLPIFSLSCQQGDPRRGWISYS